MNGIFRHLKARTKLALFGLIAGLFVVAVAAPVVAGIPGALDTLAFLPVVGLLVNRDTVSAIFENLKALFGQAFSGAPTQWAETAMEVPSTGAQNTYNWVDRFPKMREWIGDKVVKNLSAHKFSILNKPFECTVGVDRDDIEDDNLGIYKPQAESAGQSSAKLRDELISALKNAAFAALCYDGQYFYDTDHPVGDGVGGTTSVSNKGTVALSAASVAAAQASYGAARAAIAAFKDDEGRPLGLVPNVLEVPPALETVGNMLCNSDKLADGAPNPFKGLAKCIMNPLLTSTSAWFLHCTTQPVKPFVYQNRKAPVFVSQTGMESDDIFSKKLFKFGAEARGNAGYTFWQMSYGSQP